MKTDNQTMIDALQALLKIDSTETPALPGLPFGKGVADALAYGLSLLRSFGLKTVNLENYCGYGEIGEGELFGVLCHVDVVPKGDGWSYPAFGAELHDGRIYARGAEDDKGPFVAALFALGQLLAEGKTPKKRVRFILGCDEESGWKCMEYYVKHAELPVSGFSPDADFPVIYCEKGVAYHHISFPLPAGVVSLTAGTRPNVVPNCAECVLAADKLVASLARSQGLTAETLDGGLMRLTAHGISAHGSHPEAGENALIKLLGALGVKYVPFHRLYAAFSQHNGEGCALSFADADSGKLTLNLGTAETENGALHFALDIRHPVTVKRQEITRILTEQLHGMRVEPGDYHDPLFVPKDDPLVTTLLDAYNTVTGEHAAPIAIGGATYARVLPHGVAFGPCFPGEPSTIHQKDENVSVKNLERMREIYYLALKNLCF